MKDLTGVFAGLREVLLEAGASLTPSVDDSTQVTLNHNGEFFAGVKLGKNYVSYYLMPLYYHTKLREHVSSELGKRFKGKTGFNFIRLEQSHKQDLLTLTCTALEQLKGDATS